ncbi:MAG TPA: HEAT repeat domain-containing protein [Bryobacteraceae bacterium]|jgi:anti-sigma factor RsiW|nr:HEAT repeat domain-containing protein [Bryobacteraceae bacterium]
MTCHEAQTKLSLYLYGELEFAEEEALEQHVSECAQCARALASEKAWHSALNAEHCDVPLELLAQCRRELQNAVTAAKPAGSSGWPWRRWAESLGFSSPQWSMRLATASFLVFVGFSAARFIDRNGLPDGVALTADNMGVADPATARIRDIEPGENHRVRITFDQQRAITGPADNDEIRAWLVAATRDEDDPGIRVDSVQMLNGQAGREVRDALLDSAQHDNNAAVRLEAVEGLRHFRDDEATQEGLVYVLQHDQNAGVRSKAIDVLAPARGAVKISPGVADALETVTRSGQPDDYVRMRCVELLQQMNAQIDVY